MAKKGYSRQGLFGINHYDTHGNKIGETHKGFFEEEKHYDAKGNKIGHVEEQKTQLYIMSTDGFANSYLTQNDFYKTCRDYYRLIKEHGFETVAANLKDWLKETSELGCGDDITVVMAYFD